MSVRILSNSKMSVASQINYNDVRWSEMCFFTEGMPFEVCSGLSFKW